MKQIKLDRIFAAGCLLFGIGMFLSHIPFIAQMTFGILDALLSGMGAGLIITGLIPQQVKVKLKAAKRRLFYSHKKHRGTV